VVERAKGQGPVATAREVWEHRRLVGFLGKKSFRKLYARTMLGWSWVFIGPLFPMLLNLFVFGALIGVTSEGIPYFLFLAIGNLSWDFFASGLMWSTRGLEMHRKVMERVYMPRVILPIATMTPAAFNFLINFSVTALVAVYYWVAHGTTYLSLGVNTLWSIASLAMIFTLALGIAMFTSVWGEAARDARFTLSNVLALWFLATPVLYPTSQVPLRYQHWLIPEPDGVVRRGVQVRVLRDQPARPDPFSDRKLDGGGAAYGRSAFFAWRGEVEETALA